MKCGRTLPEEVSDENFSERCRPVRLAFDALEYGDEPHALYGLTPEEIKLVEGATK
jgi:hypothetical protein